MEHCPSPAAATLFAAYAPVEEFRRRRMADPQLPTVSLAAIDAFLMNRVAAYAPLPPYVIDLAADATRGDSTAFWAGTGLPTIVPRLAWHPSLEPDWRSVMRAWLVERGLYRDSAKSPSIVLVEQTLTDSSEWHRITENIPERSPILVTLAETADTAACTAAHLDLLERWVPGGWVFLLPLGLTGSGAVLASAVCACPPNGSRRLTALRELAPFFAASEIGLVGPADDPWLPSVLQRIEALIEGNFQYITLLQEMITKDAQYAACTVELESLHEAIAEKNARLRTLEATIAEKNVHIGSLEERMNYIEKTLLPWKNSVISGLEGEVRGLYASKLVRTERLVRRLVRR